MKHRALFQPGRQRPLSIVCAILLTLWLLTPTLSALWINLPDEGWRHAGLALLFALAVLVAPLSLLARPRLLFWFWLPVGMLVPLQTYLIFFFRSVPGDALTQSMLGTNARELAGLLGGFGWLPYLLPLSWLVYLVLLRGVAPSHALGKSERKGLLALLLLYVMVGMYRDDSMGEASLLPALIDAPTAASTYPASAAMSLARVLDKRWEQAGRRQVALGATAPATPQLVILVIGETLRPDHLGLNGYARNTTPELGKRGKQMISFSNVASTANFTMAAMPNLVGQVRQDGNATLVGAFREAGYTTAWLSNQERDVYTPHAEVEYFSQTNWSAGLRYDSVLLPHLSACLRQCGERQFIVLHILGSHFPYDARYPAERKAFTPTYGGMVKASITLANKRELVNSYDNSILETDRFLAQVIAQAEASGKPAILMFTADHGENLYDDERNYVLHSGEKPSRFDTFVPLLVWTSQAYRQAHPEKLAALQTNLAAPISHVDVMPTLLDLAQVNYQGKQAHQSFADTRFAPAKRFVFSSGVPSTPVDSLR